MKKITKEQLTVVNETNEDKVNIIESKRYMAKALKQIHVILIESGLSYFIPDNEMERIEKNMDKHFQYEYKGDSATLTFEDEDLLDLTKEILHNYYEKYMTKYYK